MASMTWSGFWAVAALSRYTSGLPWTDCLRTGKSARTFSTSKPVATLLVMVLMEFLEEIFLQRFLQRRNFNAVHDVFGKRVRQQAARFAPADTAGTQVEHSLRIELPDGGAVSTSHVVGMDLQLRLGVDDGIVAQHQVFVGLFRIGLLRVFAHDDAAIEDGVGAVVQNSLVELVTGAVWL